MCINGGTFIDFDHSPGSWVSSDAAGIRQVAAHHHLFFEGDERTNLYVIESGWVKLYREISSGDEVVVALCTSGDTFAAAVMFLGARYPVSAEAVSPVGLLHVNGGVLREALMQNPQISFGMLAASSIDRD